MEALWGGQRGGGPGPTLLGGWPQLWNWHLLCACVCKRETMYVRTRKRKMFSHYFLPHQKSASCKDRVSVCFLICSSFPARICCQTFQGSFSYCFSMHPDTTVNRSVFHCSVSSTWDLFLSECSFNLFLLTFHKQFSNISIWDTGL